MVTLMETKLLCFYSAGLPPFIVLIRKKIVLHDAKLSLQVQVLHIYTCL